MDGPLTLSGPTRDAPILPRDVRSIFLSDIHLGCPGCRARQLLDFLRSHRAERIYLLGDVIDVWMTRERQRWPREQAEVLTALLAEANAGVEVIYLLGNHDLALRLISGISLGGVRIARQWIHESPDGSRTLLAHGDQWDRFCTQYAWLSRLAARGYYALMAFNQRINRRRAERDRAPVDLCLSLRKRSKRFSLRVSRFEHALVEHARAQDCSRVICGHVHLPERREYDGVTYWNTGDWVEHASAILEHHDGAMELVDWSREPAPAERLRTAAS